MDTTLSLEAQAAALDNQKEMLRTLHLAYLYALDHVRSFPGAPLLEPHELRISVEEQRELGRRLALYWDMGRDILPKPEPRPMASEAEMIEIVYRTYREGIKEAASQ